MTKPKAPVIQLESLPISSIVLDQEIQPRQQLNQEVVEEYADSIRQAAIFPPVIVFYDGSKHWLADGFHRIRANQVNEEQEILAEVRPGTQREAYLFAAGANAAHGLRRTNADKRRAVERLLRDDEWSQWSDREIARRCGVDHKTVSKCRKELLNDPYLVNLSGEFPQTQNFILKPQQPTHRLVQRNGKAHRMDVSNIGAANPLTEPLAIPSFDPQATQPEPENCQICEDQTTSKGHIQQNISTAEVIGRRFPVPNTQRTSKSNYNFCILQADIDPPKTRDEYLEVCATFLIQGPINAFSTIMSQMQNPRFAQNVLQQAEDRSENKAA